MSKLTVSTTINAPLATVWDAMWNPTHIVGWCFASDDWHCPKAVGDEPKVGGIFTNTFAAKDGSFSFDLTARYDTVEPMRRIVYTMGEMEEYFLPAGRQVEVIFETSPQPSPKGEGVSVPSPFSEGEGARGGGGVLVTEIFDAEDIHSSEQQIEGWSAILGNLKKYVEKL